PRDRGDQLARRSLRHLRPAARRGVQRAQARPAHACAAVEGGAFPRPRVAGLDHRQLARGNGVRSPASPLPWGPDPQCGDRRGAAFGDSVRIVLEALEGNSLRQVVALLDVEIFNAHYTGAADFGEGRHGPARKAALALGTDTLAMSIVTPFRQDAAALREARAL